MKKLLCAAAIAAMASGSFANEIRGVWSAGLQGTSPNATRIALSWTLEAIGDIGRLAAERQGWGADYSGPSVVCTYFVDFKSNNTLTPEPGINSICPATETIGLDISDGDVSMSEVPGLEIFGTMDLESLAVFVPDSVLGTLPANFDILGAGPRQTLEDIETNLITERGWTLASSKLTTGASSEVTRAARVYLKDDRTVPTQAGSAERPVDVIVVAYEAVASAADAEAPSVRAAVIERRTVYFDAGTQIAVASLRQALHDKYGAPNPAQAFELSENRDYSRDGELFMGNWSSSVSPCISDDSGRRKPSQVQVRWNYERPASGSGSELWGQSAEGCGAHMSILMQEQGTTGAVENMHTVLMDRDLVLNAEWRFIEAKIAPQIRTGASLAKGGGGEAPEL